MALVACGETSRERAETLDDRVAIHRVKRIRVPLEQHLIAPRAKRRRVVGAGRRRSGREALCC